MHEIVTAIVDTISGFGYIGIFIMMFLESSFFPFPSEVVMIPAGYLIFTEQMSWTPALGAAIFGSLAGALLNYYLAISLGRKLLMRYGRYFFMTEQKMDKLESFFKKHGAISTFTGRLIPGLRQYISFPAGLARMKMAPFILYTGAGAGIWVLILTVLGFLIGENQHLAKEYLHQILLITLFLVVLIIGFYIKRTRNEIDA